MRREPDRRRRPGLRAVHAGAAAMLPDAGDGELHADRRDHAATAAAAVNELRITNYELRIAQACHS